MSIIQGQVHIYVLCGQTIGTPGRAANTHVAGLIYPLAQYDLLRNLPNTYRHRHPYYDDNSYYTLWDCVGVTRTIPYTLLTSLVRFTFLVLFRLSFDFKILFCEKNTRKFFCILTETIKKKAKRMKWSFLFANVCPRGLLLGILEVQSLGKALIFTFLHLKLWEIWMSSFHTLVYIYT